MRDEVVNEATKKLFRKYKKAEDYASASVDELMKYIGDVSYAGNKAKYIIASCKMLVEEYDGKVPRDKKELERLKGVGSKTANAIVQNAFGIVEGIPCDTHVLRVSYRLGWTSSKNADRVEKDLMGLFPKKEWDKIPHLLKAHGRAVCKAPVPSCSECPVNEWCPKKGVTKKN